MPLGTDQASELRTLARRCLATERSVGAARPSENRPRIITLCAGNAGVGVTTTAIDLAICLAQRENRVVLVDATMQRADLAQYCRITPHATIADVLTRQRTLREALTQGPGGVFILPGFWSPDRVCDCSPAAQNHLLDEFLELGERVDFVLLDAGHGGTQVMRRFWQASDAVLTLFAPQTSAIMAGYALIKLLHEAAPQALLGGIVNFALDQANAEQISNRVTVACQRFFGRALPLWSWLPKVERLTASRQRREAMPIVAGGSDAAAHLTKLAENLCSSFGIVAHMNYGVSANFLRAVPTGADSDPHGQSPSPIPLAA